MNIFATAACVLSSVVT